MTFTTAQPRFHSFFGGRFFSQNWHFGITKRITKHNFLVLQSTYLYFVSNEDHTFEKKNVSFLLVTSTLTESEKMLDEVNTLSRIYILAATIGYSCQHTLHENHQRMEPTRR